MELRVLGPLEVVSNNGIVTISGSMPRRLLALLGLTPGREVSTDELIAGLWPEAVSDGAGATLQSHVARLRRALPDGKWIRTGPSGYCLDLDPSDLDERVFVGAISDGHQALAQGKPSAALGAFQRALDLWRGRPYAEFVGCPSLEIESTRLEQLRVDALRGLLATELTLDDIEPPVAQLRALVQLHAADEPMWALLMLALYRTGQQAEALKAFQQARAHLVEELGIEPGPELQGMEHRILSGDPMLNPGNGLAPDPTPASKLADRRFIPERRTTSVVAIRIPSADNADPEHVLGAALVVAQWERDKGNFDAAVKTLQSAGPLVNFVERDGAVELLPSAVRLAWMLGCDALLEGLDTAVDERSPLRRVLKLHLEGLLAASRDDRAAVRLLIEALCGWESRGSVTEGAHARSDLVRLSLSHQR